MENNKKLIIHATVFIAGATTMILELVGSRIIAPYFGSSIYTWTSLIGIILGSLSIGYWLGGKLADKNASLKILANILFLCSLLCTILYLSANEVLKIIFENISSITTGTFVSALTIFTIPSIIFGLIPPYAAKLKLDSLKNSGKTMGNLYALSTIGSIFGTFITGFYLLSMLGSFQIILMISLVLLLNSFFLDLRTFNIHRAILLVIILWLFFSEWSINYDLKNISFMKVINSGYNTYFVAEGKDTLGATRSLRTDFRSSQSGYYVNNNKTLYYRYSKYLTIPTCFGQDSNTLMIGGGGFSYAKYVMEKFPDKRMDVIEIDPKLTQIAEDYLELAQNRPNVTIINTDGRTYLNTNTKTYDSIIIDAFDTFTIPFHLTTFEAVQKMHSSLSANGIVVMNLISPIENNGNNFLKSEFETYKNIFEDVEVYKVRKNANPEEWQNLILVAYKGSKPEASSDCLFLQENLDENNIHYEGSSDGIILTDNYAPIEYLSLIGMKD